MATYDAAVILSQDDLIFKNEEWQLTEKTKERINSGIQLSKRARQRVDMGVELFKNNQVNKLIITGGFAELFNNISIAENMTKYAIEKGMDEKNILKETNALDTVGQLLFVKLGIIKLLNLKKIIIVTHNYHAERVRKQAEFIFGKDYKIKIEIVSSEEITPISAEKEQASYETFLKTFEGVESGDDKNILETLLEKHSLYNQNREKFEQGLQELTNQNQEF